MGEIRQIRVLVVYERQVEVWVDACDYDDAVYAAAEQQTEPKLCAQCKEDCAHEEPKYFVEIQDEWTRVEI